VSSPVVFSAILEMTRCSPKYLNKVKKEVLCTPCPTDEIGPLKPNSSNIVP